jgi:hypothetical protein
MSREASRVQEGRGVRDAMVKGGRGERVPDGACMEPGGWFIIAHRLMRNPVRAVFSVRCGGRSVAVPGKTLTPK